MKQKEVHMQACKRVIIPSFLILFCYMYRAYGNASQIPQAQASLPATPTTIHAAGNTSQGQTPTQTTVGVASVAATSIASNAASSTPAQADSAFQNKFKEVAGKVTVVEKILGGKEIVSLITASSVVADKNAIITLANDLFGQQGTMKKDELKALEGLFSDITKNKFLLAPNQIPTVEEWIKSMQTSADLVSADKTLLDAVKEKLDVAKVGFPTAIKAAFVALQLLDSKIPAAELSKQGALTTGGPLPSLVVILRTRMTAFFNARTGRTQEEVASLKNFFSSSAKNTYLADAVNKSWEVQLGITQAIASVDKAVTILEKIKTLSSISQTLTPQLDGAEKRAYLNEIDKIVLVRNQRAMREIDELNNLLISITSDAFKGKKIFTDAETKKMLEWRKLLTNTQSLLSIQQKRSLDEKIKLLNSAMIWLGNPQFEYERKMFVGILSDLFALRVDLHLPDLKRIKTFFEGVQKTQDVLAPNQVKILELWLQELDVAVQIVTGKLSYLDALLNNAKETKSIPQYAKILTLIAHDYDSAIKDALVNGLNTLFSERKTLDKVGLLALLRDAQEKKVAGHYFLTAKQRDILGQWRKFIPKE